MGFWDSLKEAMGLADAAAREDSSLAERRAGAARRSPLEIELIKRLQANGQTYQRGETQTGAPAASAPVSSAPAASQDESPRIGGGEVVRLALSFSGDVQGVGFRWTNQGLARDRGLTGWVRNEGDGTVSMEIQGRATDIAAHLDALHDYYRRFGNRIWLESERQLKPSMNDSSFEVRY